MPTEASNRPDASAGSAGAEPKGSRGARDASDLVNAEPWTSGADLLAPTEPASAVGVVSIIDTPIDAGDEPAGRPESGRMVRGAAMTAVANGILPVTSIISGPLLARALAPAGRGEMTAVLAPLFVATFIVSTGLPDATTYAVARLGLPMRRVARISSWILLPLGLGGTCLLWFGAPTIEHGTPSAIQGLRYASLALPLLMFALSQRSFVAGAGRYGAVTIERTTASLARLLFILVLVVTSLMTSEVAVWCNIAGNLIAAAWLLRQVLRHGREWDDESALKRREPPPELTDAQLAGRMWSYGLRGWGGVFANLVNWRLDQAILPALTGATQIGYYAIAVSLAEVPSMIIGATKAVVFTESSQRGDLRLAARATRIVILLSLVADLLLAIGANYVVPLLFGHAFDPAIKMTRILLVANIPWTAEVVLATGLLSVGRPGLRSVGQIVAAVITGIGLAALVPSMGAEGAAWTSLAAYTVNFLMSAVFFRRVSGLPFHEALIPRRADVLYLVRLGGRVLRKLTKLALRR